MQRLVQEYRDIGLLKGLQNSDNGIRVMESFTRLYAEKNGLTAPEPITLQALPTLPTRVDILDTTDEEISGDEVGPSPVDNAPCCCSPAQR